jgi:AAA domain
VGRSFEPESVPTRGQRFNRAAPAPRPLERRRRQAPPVVEKYEGFVSSQQHSHLFFTTVEMTRRLPVVNGHPRDLESHVRTDLRRKMVFLSGTRLVGKTTLARRLLAGRHGYLNWDVPADRAAILADEFPLASLWVLDEFHKYPRLMNHLKSLFDGREKGQQILVTGSVGQGECDPCGQVEIRG